MCVAESQNPIQSLKVLPPPPGVLCADSLGLVLAPGERPRVPALEPPPPEATGGWVCGDSGETCCCWGPVCPSPGVGAGVADDEDGVFGTKLELPLVGAPGCKAEGAGLDGIAEGGLGTKLEPGAVEDAPGLAAGAAAPPPAPELPLPDCAFAYGTIKPRASTVAMALVLVERTEYMVEAQFFQVWLPWLNLSEQKMVPHEGTRRCC
jgi:hypothetical protein